MDITQQKYQDFKDIIKELEKRYEGDLGIEFFLDLGKTKKALTDILAFIDERTKMGIKQIMDENNLISTQFGNWIVKKRKNAGSVEITDMDKLVKTCPQVCSWTADKKELAKMLKLNGDRIEGAILKDGTVGLTVSYKP